MAENQPLVSAGTTLANKYRVERVLGQGGMGVVVAARHLELDQRVAIKFLVAAQNPRAVDRFLREARTAAKVKSEHVCRVFDFGRLEGGEPYLVMEYLEGIDLKDRLIRDGALPTELVTGWIIEICDALAEAHAAGIVHRDLKPENVFLASRSDGSVCAKLLDFGIAKRLGTASWQTLPKSMLGSPAYISPEQIGSSRDVGPRADVWSLGVMLYELLSGELPFRGESMAELIFTIRREEPRPLLAVKRSVPEALSQVVAKCLAKKAVDRYASVAELAAELAPFASRDAQSIVTRLARRIPLPSDPSLVVLSGPDPSDPRAELAEDPTEPARPTPTSLARAVSDPTEPARPTPTSVARVASDPIPSEPEGAVAPPAPVPSVAPDSSGAGGGFYVPSANPSARAIPLDLVGPEKSPVAAEKSPVAAKKSLVASEKSPVAAKESPVATKKSPSGSRGRGRLVAAALVGVLVAAAVWLAYRLATRSERVVLEPSNSPVIASAADAAHRDARGGSFGAAFPGLAVGFHRPSPRDSARDRVRVALTRDLPGADAVVGGEARSERAVGGDAEAIAALAVRVAGARDEADLLRRVVPREEILGRPAIGFTLRFTAVE
jgi:eukaryotic-like serine/threonine-protein kinase